MHGSIPYAAAMSHALVRACEADASVRVWTEGASAWSEELARALPERVLAWPIADRARAAVALGACWGGARVVIELASAERLFALAEVLAAAGRVRSGFGAPLVLRVPWGGEVGAVDGPVLSLLAGIAGLRVVVPRDGAQAVGLLRGALAATLPTVLLEPRRLVREAGPVDARVCTGAEAEVVRPGLQVVVAALGAEVAEALAVAAALEAEGVSVEVVDLVGASPPGAGLGARVVSVGRVVVVAPPEEGAWGLRVVQGVVEEAFLHLEAPPLVVPIGQLTRAVRDTVTY